MGRADAAALEVDPVIEQTRAVTRQLFASELALRGGVRHAEPVIAFDGWRAAALLARDRGLVSILDRLDVETFGQTWRELVSVLRFRGARGTLEWLSGEL